MDGPSEPFLNPFRSKGLSHRKKARENIPLRSSEDALECWGKRMLVFSLVSIKKQKRYHHNRQLSTGNSGLALDQCLGSSPCSIQNAGEDQVAGYEK